VSLIEGAAAAIYAAVGLVHLLPGLAFFAPTMITRLYGSGADGAVLLMLRHRAALLGVVGIVLVIAAALPSWRPAATLVGALSMASYFTLWLGAGAFRKPLQKIALVDAVALPALLAALVLTRG
jgi:uncharacterized membrane protein